MNMVEDYSWLIDIGACFDNFKDLLCNIDWVLKYYRG